MTTIDRAALRRVAGRSVGVMARPLRISFPGALYHVMARGNAQEDVFRDEVDYEAFLDLLARTIERYDWICHSFCLMTNHYHLVIETPRANLPNGMRQLNGLYAARFNRRHDRCGHVFQSRYARSSSRRRRTS